VINVKTILKDVTNQVHEWVENDRKYIMISISSDG